MLASESWRDWALKHVSGAPRQLYRPAHLLERIVDCISIHSQYFLPPTEFHWRTHGGLKYCSIKTHIPRAISVNRKYLPAWSSADSLLSSHLCGFGNLKPAGGGPWGVAYARRAVVEKAAIGVNWPGVKLRAAPARLAVGRIRATSIVKGFVDAIVVLARGVEGWSISRVVLESSPKLMYYINAVPVIGSNWSFRLGLKWISVIAPVLGITLKTSSIARF